ncbi:MAG: DUF255 domain-containing protein [Candidatus Obscuribacterales bacterium]|jgi:uncharacterized protein YyaL (SSP411 family)|nr:DUF255 domain-containing protein [Candidatus Obscuribacterales bacterium]
MRKSLGVALSCFVLLTNSSPSIAGDSEAKIAAAGAQPQASHELGGPAWQPWTKDLFTRAKKEKKLVVLDLEAIWCHWCHVMDQKTYSRPDIQKVLAQHFIAVKVDQDSRPDLSNKYEQYGWPATIFFSSDGKELAKRSGFIRPDEMLALLKKLVKKPVPEEEGSVPTVFSKDTALPAALKEELIKKHNDGYDPKEGGWGTQNKFLDWDSVEYALARGKEGDARELQMAKETLEKQLNLIDPVWGGVYQYSTDGDWKHAHFEKIMQMQGENLRIYSLGYLQFKDPRFLDAAKSIAGYLKEFLQAPEGAFYTSQDADLKPGEHSAEYFDLNNEERRKLGVPRVDKHIYARENGWAITGLTSLYMATADKQYLDQAIKAAQWIISNRAIPGGGFKHDASDPAGPYLGDTLFMGRAFLNLYQATGDRQWLTRASDAGQFIAQHFKIAPNQAGYPTAATDSSADNEAAQAKPLLDENIVLARVSNMLFQYTGKKEYKDMADNCMRYLSTPEIARLRRILVAGTLLSDKEISSSPAHITIVGAKSDAAALTLFQAANRYPVSYKRVEWYDPKEGPMPNPDTEYPEMPKAAAFACANQRCSLPVYTPEGIASSVENMMKSQ